MASVTRIYKVRKNLKDRKAGLERKNKLNRDGSTPTKAVFFGDKEEDDKKAS